MPTATKHSIILEESHLAAAGDRTDNGQLSGRTKLPSPPSLDMKLFEDIRNLMEDAKKFEDHEREALRKIEKYNNCIKAAEETIAKAQLKKEVLQKRNEFLRNCLDELEERKVKALKYWEDFGIDVKQISNDDSDFQQYEFNYTKLKCTVNLRHQNNRLEIVDQYPELLSTNDLNDRLTKNCVNPSGQVDYKLAMLTIKKELVRSSSKNKE